MATRTLITTFIKQFNQSFNDELKVIFKRFTHHWLLWILPLLVFTLISSIFSMGVLQNLPVGVVDQDNSSVSRLLIRDLDAGPHAQLINYDNRFVQAEKDLAKAKIYALLYIPAHFEDDLLAGKQPTPIFYYNALYYSAGLYSIMDYSGLISDLNSQYRSIMATKVGIAMPNLAKVNFNYDGLFNASGNSMYFQQFSAVVHLLQLFVVTMTIHILGKLPRGTRVSYSSVLGKLAPYAFWYSALLMFEISLLVLFSKAYVSGNPLYMLVVIVFYVMAAQSIGILLFSITKSTIDAYSYIGLLVGLALTYSGVVVPELSMPLVAKVISSIEPLTYALNTLFGLFLRHVGAVDVLKTCLILTVYPIIITLFVRNRLAKRLYKREVL